MRMVPFIGEGQCLLTGVINTKLVPTSSFVYRHRYARRDRGVFAIVKVRLLEGAMERGDSEYRRWTRNPGRIVCDRILNIERLY